MAEKRFTQIPSQKKNPQSGCTTLRQGEVVGVFAGIDIGASAAKAAVMGADSQVLGYAVRRSGVDFAGSAAKAYDAALSGAGLGKDEIKAVFSCGYGRKNAAFADQAKTEIACHGAAAFHFFPQPLTVIDIGGQDNKIIKLNARGQRINFMMNRKCAAGTGAFLQEMALRLDVALADFDALARQAEEEITLGAFCTVFTATEVLAKIRQGAPISGLVKGLFRSVVKRVMEMDVMEGLVVMTGGVAAHNPFLVEMMTQALGQEVVTPPHPQLAGAIGAALLARKGQTN